MRTVALLATSLIASFAAFGDAPRVLRPDDLATRFVESWNAHAFADFGEHLETDTDWITASGLVLRGRTAIVDYLGDEHATWARETGMTATRVVVRELSQSTAIVRLEWQIRSSAAEKAPPAFPGVTQFVAARASGGWRVVAGQVTSGRSRAASPGAMSPGAIFPGASATSETSPKRRRPSIDRQVLGSVTPR